MGLTDTAAFARAATARIRLTYLWRHQRLPDLATPLRFTEHVQWRKLHDRDPRMPAMADKVAVKAIVADRLGPEWVVPLLWAGEALPQTPDWRQPAILKARHGCNQNRVMIGRNACWITAARASGRWMRTSYGAWLDEWLYAQIPRGLLVEPFIGVGRQLPVDYKIYVFGGQATHVQVHLDRGTDHRWVVHDTDWRAVAGGLSDIPRPSALSAMLAAAEALAHGFDFVRVDFYQPGTQPVFGEMTFYPGSGLDPFDPPELDIEMGQLWRAAREASHRARDGRILAARTAHLAGEAGEPAAARAAGGAAAKADVAVETGERLAA